MGRGSLTSFKAREMAMASMAPIQMGRTAFSD